MKRKIKKKVKKAIVYYLGKLCPRNHEYEKTGKSLRYNISKQCVICESERGKENYRKSRMEILNRDL